MKSSPRHWLWFESIALCALGIAAIVTSPRNNPFEGWGLLVRALVGEALLIAAVDRAVRARTGRRSIHAMRNAMVVVSIVLAPLAAILVLMTKESGPSWSIAAILLFVWFVVSGALAAFLPAATDDRDKD